MVLWLALACMGKNDVDAVPTEDAATPHTVRPPVSDTAEPEDTGTPGDTDAPDTDAPLDTDIPDTDEPADTDVPEDTDVPDTDEPVDTDQPVDTDLPGDTGEPQDTDEPVDTDIPEDTGDLGDISGSAEVCVTVLDAHGLPIHEAPVAVQPSGTATHSEVHWTGTDGRRCYPGVRSGSAAVVVHEPFHWRPTVVDVVVPTSGTLEVPAIQLSGGVSIQSTSWLWGWSFSQEFVATGDALLKASIQVASDPQTLRVELRDSVGGPVRCTSFLHAGGGGRGTATFGGREVCPLVPGASYALTIEPVETTLGGWAPYLQEPGAYPGGLGYFGADPATFDLAITLDEDTGTLVTEHTSQHGGCVGYDDEFALEFDAEGTSMASVGFMVGGISSQTTMTIQIEDATGQPIGPAKTTATWPDNLAVVGFGPHEVPMSPGSTYRAVLTGPQNFCLYADDRPTSHRGAQLFEGPNAWPSHSAWARIVSRR